ncbi:hypothetical protein V6N13_001153 [Hibiscus sabdariffa]|uniref:RING-type E3 ubiquitin transferase n=1 Tax=Hibiscus sabdariffa TaxID=183260 RepID=A0ABR2G7H3_9ROSI
MSVSLDSPDQTSNPISHLLRSIPSYDGNVLLAAIISLLLVILFVLLLHVYAKWFLAQARRRSRSSSLSHVFRPDRFRHFHAFTFDATFPTTPSKGLDPSAISSIPLFVFKAEQHYKLGSECVICLSLFEDNEVGRNLPKCGHGFHVECIDMWLHSHSNCPVCRAPVLSNDTDSEVSSLETGVEALNGENLNDSSDSGAAAIDDNDNDNDNLSATSSLTLSLKRMLSRNRSERKVFPSSIPSELQV